MRFVFVKAQGRIALAMFDQNYISSTGTFDIQLSCYHPDLVDWVSLTLTDKTLQEEGSTADYYHQYQLVASDDVQTLLLSDGPSFDPAHEYAYVLEYYADNKTITVSFVDSFKFKIDGEEQTDQQSDPTGTFYQDRERG